MDDSERVEVNRGEHAYSVQVGMDPDLMEWAMTNAEAIAEQQCQSSLVYCKIDELVEEDSVVGSRLDARNADGSTFIAHWESGSTQFQVYSVPDTSEHYSDLLPPRHPKRSYSPGPLRVGFCWPARDPSDAWPRGMRLLSWRAP